MFWKRKNKVADEGPKLVAAISEALRRDGIPHEAMPARLAVALSEEVEADLSPLLGEWLECTPAQRQELVADVIGQWQDEGIVLSLDAFDARLSAMWAEVGVTATTRPDGVTELPELGTSLSFRNLYPDCCGLEFPAGVDEQIRVARDSFREILDSERSEKTLATICSVERVDELVLRALFEAGIPEDDLQLRFVDRGLVQGRFIDRVGRVERDRSTFRRGEEPEELIAHNCEAFIEGTREAPLNFVRFTDGSFGAQVGPDQGVTLLLFPQLLVETLGRDLSGEPVVFVGSTTDVHVLGSNDPDALASVAETFLELPTHRPPLMWRPVMLDGDVWVPVRVDEGHRAAELVAALEARQRLHDFSRLYPWVGRAHELPAGLYVSWVHPTSGLPAGVTLWRAASVLYEADLIGLDMDGTVLLVSWLDALALDTEEELVRSETTWSSWYVTAGPPSASFVGRLLTVGTLDPMLPLPSE